MTVSTKTVVIVGAGFFGAVMAERLASAGCKVLVLDKRGHIGGNSWSFAGPETGIEEHVYGPHIFHTSKPAVWEYINRFTTFNDYRHTVWAKRNGRVYPLPFGLASINLLLQQVLSPAEAKAWVAEAAAKENIGEAQNLEEKALSLIGRPLYEAFVKEYTEKHWGRAATELPAFIISRLPVHYTYSTNYYNDVWQGIPIGGYGAMFSRLLAHPNIEVRVETDYFAAKASLPPHELLIYTGPIDRFFDYQHGHLGWRAVRFEREVLETDNYQGTSVMNECDGAVPFTRTHEFKHFTPELSFERTVIYREFSFAPKPGEDAHYPIRAPADLAMLAKYEAEAAALPNILFGGRLGTYRYLDMDQAIAAALEAFAALKL